MIYQVVIEPSFLPWLFARTSDIDDLRPIQDPVRLNICFIRSKESPPWRDLRRGPMDQSLVSPQPALGHELGPSGAQAEGSHFFDDTPMTITDTSGVIPMKSGDTE